MTTTDQKPGSVRYVTYGCKANQYDTQVLREALGRRGLAEVDRGADLVVVNTCTVTAEAGRKARQLIRRIHRETPKTRIAVTGCLAESEPEVLRELPGVDWVLGNGDAKRPVQFLRQLGWEADPEELGIPAGITAFAGHTRAFVKIQDGCDKACAFCIIPSTRGRSTSRPAAELAAEITALVESGHVEVVLCGIHIGHWGLDLGQSLADLLEVLVALEPRGADGQPLAYRLRLSSIEATEVCDRIVALIAARPERLAPHLHMPMQSGADRVLERMNRWYSVEEYLAACDRIRSQLDRPAFTADILVGFPGESAADFDRTLETARRAGFTKVHVFPFSARPGTAAWDLPDRVDPQAVRERRAALSELAHELGNAYQQSLVGAQETVVLEGFAGLCGRYQRVRVDPERLAGMPATVDVTLELHSSEGVERRELWGVPR
ncbi:MAG: tRNA (N(6)-L-threonylcarbamoyladenosine(37)-C(2))-methylthiotransferase MtaB [Planctomycetota bacterium]|nr:tRNA (N(6)-L-threonylcarbamoyladenosine(37)-C(2))-methylthiotransferase MtaB [Planctomycetota bacterium]